MSEKLSENEENIRQELSRLMKHFQCPICLNLMSDPMVTRCVHHFCGQCITKAIESSSVDCCRCPLCNEKITKRSLRQQLDISDIIKTFKEAVDSFESDNQMSLITDNNEVVVFDVSSDKSKSCIQISDSLDESIQTKDLNQSEDKSLNKTNESSIESSDIESNRKTTIITTVSNDWPTYEASNVSIDIRDIEETDQFFELTKTSINQLSDISLNSMSPEVDSVEPKPTQSQNLKVTKSRITYSSSRPSTDDKFDRIIRLTEINSNLNQNKPKNRPQKVVHKTDSKMESEDLRNEDNNYRRKPLTQLNKNQNKKLCQKKRLKRVQAFDSSDDEVNEIETKDNTENNKIESNDKNGANNQRESHLSDNDNSNDLFLPAIHNKNTTIEINRSIQSLRDESRDGYNSDTQLISSSPVSDF